MKNVDTDISELARVLLEANPEARALLGMIFLAESCHADSLGGMEWRRRQEEAGGWEPLVERYAADMERAARRLDDEETHMIVAEARAEDQGGHPLGSPGFMALRR